MTRRRGGTCGESGFTLVEILVSLVIVALAMGALLRIFSSGLRSANTAEQYTTAVLLAESKLAAAGIEEPLGEGETSGTFDNGFRWTSRVRAYDGGGQADPTGSVEAYEVSVAVAWGGLAGERSVELTTLRLAAGR